MIIDWSNYPVDYAEDVGGPKNPYSGVAWYPWYQGTISDNEVGHLNPHLNPYLKGNMQGGDES